MAPSGPAKPSISEPLKLIVRLDGSKLTPIDSSSFKKLSTGSVASIGLPRHPQRHLLD